MTRVFDKTNSHLSACLWDAFDVANCSAILVFFTKYKAALVFNILIAVQYFMYGLSNMPK